MVRRPFRLIRFAVERPDAYRLMFELGQPDPDGYPGLREAELRAWAPLHGGVGAAVAAGVLAGDPDEIAKAVQFILENDYVSGRCIDVDGALRL